jgi:hypothetical protein
MALYFPYDNRNDYPGKITFRSFAPPVPETDFPGVYGVLKDIGESFQNNSSSQALPTGVDVGDRYQYGTRSNKRNYSGQRVTLYLPQAITFADQADYESNVQLGALGATAEATINRGGSAGAALGNAMRDAKAVANDIFTGNSGATGEAARLAAVRIANFAPGQTIGNVTASVLRTAVNPNKRTLFRSVNIREFSFQFKMIANSRREAIEIENIIKFFRTELYPSVTGSGTELIGYNFPNLFDIDMKYNNQPVATKIKPVYLRNVTTTYNPSSMGWHADGKPSEVDVTLAFVEERTLNKADVAGGY